MGFFDGIKSLAGPVLGAVGTAVGGPVGGAIGGTIGSAISGSGGSSGGSSGGTVSTQGGPTVVQSNPLDFYAQYGAQAAAANNPPLSPINQNGSK